MRTRKQLAENRALCTDKALGCLAGLAIGDTIGDQARSPENHIRYGITRDLYGNQSSSTDDTEFALLTALACIETGGRADPRGDGRPVARARAQRAGPGSEGGEPAARRGRKPAARHHAPYSGIDNCDNYDDGAAMRVAPIGVICAGDPARAAHLAAVDAEISHAQDGVWGAQAIAASIAVAMVDGSVEEVIAAGMDCIPEDSWLARWLARGFAICDAAGDLESAWDWLHDDLWTAVRCSNPEALAETYALFRLTDGDFEKGVIAAANFGRDADTLAALVGALAGALHGGASIPEGWIEKTRRPAGTCLPFAAELDIVTVAEDLAALIR
ncbi:MAG: ADP-ribosylglycohydrolase family protein [Anaerolineae bacterium]|nr:ADP-ribosylglycohydrolase family protein [Anaerolineae bacterium]